MNDSTITIEEARKLGATMAVSLMVPAESRDQAVKQASELHDSYVTAKETSKKANVEKLVARVRAMHANPEGALKQASVCQQQYDMVVQKRKVIHDAIQSQQP